MERRRAVRIPVNMIVELITSKGITDRGIARLKDISIGGMAIESELKLWKGSTIFLSMHIPVMVRGKVVYENPTDVSGVRRYGIKFESLGFLEKINLKRFIKAQIK